RFQGHLALNCSPHLQVHWLASNRKETSQSRSLGFIWNGLQNTGHCRNANYPNLECIKFTIVIPSIHLSFLLQIHCVGLASNPPLNEVQIQESGVCVCIYSQQPKKRESTSKG